eukprot:9715014-Ditylum_brightwellii.AAC.1
MEKDCNPFQLPIIEWESRSVTDMQQWLAINQLYIKSCQQLANEQLNAQTSDIGFFLCKQEHQPITRRKIT